ncbi:hypothetical protein Gotri_024980 [Gossypium trilobum]|uniref:Uncharacterized protein n=1 Tax=Gossypium trilobum TaxID=34281 RepID=A0A7J9FSZ7_9ROSI|nr:hypothetical protein [Gossypium trilobum]
MMNSIENDLARLQIDDVEEEAWSFPGESGVQKSAYDLCLVHDLPLDFFSKNMAKQFGDFVGKFLKYDAKQLSRCLGHGDNFCQIRITHGLKEIEFGWDLSLKAQLRRVTTTTSVWLKDDDNDDFLGAKNEVQNLGRNSSEGLKTDTRQEINPILGFNLERTSKLDGTNRMGPSSGSNRANIDEDLEERPIETGDEKKRPRSDKQILNKSIRTILLKLKERREEICNKKILTAANRQADQS